MKVRGLLLLCILVTR